MAINWTDGALRGAFPAAQADPLIEPPIDPITQQFKKAMRRLTGTVSIIATQEHSLRYGMVVTAVNAVCMEPPAILVCVNRSATIYDPLARTRRFSVNMLAEGQHALVAPFSSKIGHEERFSHGHWSDLAGLPVLAGAQATLFCTVDGTLSYGSHDILVGHVEAVDVAEPVAPLLWQDGRPTASRVLHA
jgi:flavin reductase (DIM6/NTAB) family NADH-FMN oxidoreductase RutF